MVMLSLASPLFGEDALPPADESPAGATASHLWFNDQQLEQQSFLQPGPPPGDYYERSTQPSFAASPANDIFAPLPLGPWREFRARSTWLGGSDLNFVELETWSIFALPTFSLNSPIVFTPFYGLHLADGPPSPDLPARLHDIYVDVNWIFNVEPQPGEWSLHLAVRPGVYSDFEQGLDDAFRLQARGLAIYRYSETVTLVAGGQWLDREDVPFLPLGGVIYKPNDSTLIELLSPRSKLATRVAACGGCSTWVYLAGEFGGESWAIERASGALDRVAYSDLRLMAGVERKSEAGPIAYLEAGWVFNRRLEYESGTPPEFDAQDAFLLRAGIGF